VGSRGWGTGLHKLVRGRKGLVSREESNRDPANGTSLDLHGRGGGGWVSGSIAL